MPKTHSSLVVPFSAALLLYFWFILTCIKANHLHLPGPVHLIFRLKDRCDSGAFNHSWLGLWFSLSRLSCIRVVSSISVSSLPLCCSPVTGKGVEGGGDEGPPYSSGHPSTDSSPAPLDHKTSPPKVTEFLSFKLTKDCQMPPF